MVPVEQALEATAKEKRSSALIPADFLKPHLFNMPMDLWLFFGRMPRQRGAHPLEFSNT